MRHHQRHHDLDRHRLAGRPAGLDRAFENGARLHLGDFRIGDRDAHAAEAEHRIELVQFGGAALELGRVGAHGGGDFGDLAFAMRQEFMQRRIEQADRHRQARHDLEQFREIAALHRQQLGERGATALLVVGEDHLAHRDDAVAVEEHVLGAAEADAFGTETARDAGVGRRFGIGAHLHAPHRVGPFHDRGEFAGKFRVAHGDGAFEHLAGRPVDGDHVAFLQRPPGRDHRLARIIDADRAGARDAGLAHAARDDRGVRGHAAAGGENPFGRMHAVNVFGRRLDPHQDHFAAGALGGFRLLRGEDDLAARRPGRGRQARRENLAFGFRIDGRMQQLIERGGIDAADRLRARDEAFCGHVDGDAQRGFGGAFAAARLQHPQLAALDGEFHVLHVAIMAFERLRRAHEFGEDAGQQRLHRRLVGMRGEPRRLGDVLRRADAGDHVLALRIDEEFAIEFAWRRSRDCG